MKNDVIHVRLSEDERGVVEKIKTENTRPGLRISDSDAVHIALAEWAVISVGKKLEADLSMSILPHPEDAAPVPVLKYQGRSE